MAIKKARKKVAKPIKKSAPKKAAAKKAPAKKAAAKKTPAKKAASKEVLGSAGQLLPRDFDDNGFVKGSNTAIIVETMLEGAVDRKDLNQKIVKAIGKNTKAEDIARNVPSMVTAILRKLENDGYTVESSWRLVKGEAKGKKKGAKKIASAPSKSPAKKKVAKKVAKKVTKKRK